MFKRFLKFFSEQSHLGGNSNKVNVNQEQDKLLRNLVVLSKYFLGVSRVKHPFKIKDFLRKIKSTLVTKGRK